MKRFIHSTISKGGKLFALAFALLLLNATAYADVVSSLSYDDADGYHQTSNLLTKGALGEMIADNGIQFSNSDPDQHQHYIITFQSDDDQQCAITQHCTLALLLIDRHAAHSGCPQCPRVFINGPPVGVGC